MEQKTDLSVIIPLYNEAGNVKPLFKKLTSVLTNLNKISEIIAIDDGSKDNTFKFLQEIQKENQKITIIIIKLRKNYGQTAALSCGFDYSKGEIIVVLDGDLQNDPEDIPYLLKKMEEGYDIVSGWRKKRKVSFLFRRLPSLIANWIISQVTGIRLHDFGCTLKAYQKEVIKNINLYGEMHRFIPVLASALGVKIAEIEVKDHKRKYGVSKYNIFRFPKVILDLITVKFFLFYSPRPVHVFGILGFFSIFCSIITAMIVIYFKIIYKKDITGNPLFLLTILLILIGIQFIILGLLGEIMVRTYHETQNKPIYKIKEIIK